MSYHTSLPVTVEFGYNTSLSAHLPMYMFTIEAAIIVDRIFDLFI